MSVDASDVHTNLSILDLPNIVTLLYQRADRHLLPDAQATPGLFVRYLRRKPARGLAIIYTVDELGRANKAHSNDPNRSVSLTLDEQALDGARIRFTKAQAQEAQLSKCKRQVCCALIDIGLSVQAFPADSSLPALAASCDTTPHSRYSRHCNLLLVSNLAMIPGSLFLPEQCQYATNQLIAVSFATILPSNMERMMEQQPEI